MKKGKFGVIICAAVFVAIFSATPLWAISSSSYELGMGIVPLGSCNTEVLTLTNDEGTTVVIDDYEFLWSSTAFSVAAAPPLPYILPDGASVDFTVQFCPVMDSFDQGTLVIYTDSASTPTIYVTVWGEGIIGGCVPPEVDCGGMCVDLNYDVHNCGACGNVCPDPVGGAAICDMGVCGYDCGVSTECDGVCVETQNDPDNCGACGNVCPDPVGGEAGCVYGECTFNCGVYTECDGVCVDTQNDPDNCGACGNVCAASEVCVYGECTLDCGDLTDCDGVCVDTDTDVNNCGDCGIICPAAPPNGTALCDAGLCDFECNPGFIRDGDACVPLATYPRDLLVDLIEFYWDSLADGTLEGTGGGWWWWGRLFRQWIMGRHFTLALAQYDLGRMHRVCFLLERAYLRCDDIRRPRDYVRGPAAPELSDRILEIMDVLECP